MNDAPINFRELLSQPSDAVERPVKLPTGHYRAAIGQHTFDRSSKKQTAFVRFELRIAAPTADVDQVALQTVLEAGRKQLTDVAINKDYYITPKSLYRLTDMLDAVLGKQQGRSFDDRIPTTRGADVIIGVTPRRNEDGTESDFNDVTTIVAA